PRALGRAPPAALPGILAAAGGHRTLPGQGPVDPATAALRHPRTRDLSPDWSAVDPTDLRSTRGSAALVPPADGDLRARWGGGGEPRSSPELDRALALHAGNSRPV